MSAGRWAALAVLLAGAAGSQAAEPALQPIPLEALVPGIGAATPHVLGPGGLELRVEAATNLALPFRAAVVELDLTTTGPITLSWAAKTPGAAYTPFGPPWRHLTLPQARTSISLDYRITAGWAPASQPQIGLNGTGRIVIHAVRARPPDTNRETLLAGYDRANFLAPESIGQTTINTLTPSFWSASRGIWLSDVVAGVAVVAFAAVLVGSYLLRKRQRPGLALAVAALVAASLFDLHMLVRFLPMFDLRPTPDPEARIRENNWIAPDVGALSALARETLGPNERVGVLARERDWFGPQTICFNLAPRPCVIMKQNATVNHGISGVGTLKNDEIDAIVFDRGEWTPPGFEPVASLDPIRYVARRR